MWCTTYRLTEHHHYWTKNNPMNVQLCRAFVEVPANLPIRSEFAAAKVKVTSAAGVRRESDGHQTNRQ